MYSLSQAACRKTGGLMIFIVLLLHGCAAPLQSDHLFEHLPAELPPQHEITATPFFAQDDLQCGPAALATLLSYAGNNVTPEQLINEVYLPGRSGSLQIELIASTRHHGLVPFVIERNMLNLLREIAADHPVLVMQNLGLSIAPQWHYAVVVGYNLPQREIILRSGPYPRHVNSFSVFERTWQRADYWGVVILPPDKLPATADAFGYLKAASAFEQLGQLEFALRAYHTASQHWPEDVNAWMLLGNTQYQLKQLDAALHSYQHAVQLQADFAPALNNLAQVLFDQNKFAEALPYAERAVTLGGPHLHTYQETLNTIQHAMKRQPTR